MSIRTKKVKGTLLLDGSPQSIEKAAAILRKGGLVAFPTETVYGLGAIATSQEAVNKIFIAKGRPVDNPLIVHISSIKHLYEVAADLPPEAPYLARCFWPGPLSLVLRRAEVVVPEVSAGLMTVAVRMPDHPLAQQLIRAVGAPIAAPSANLAGRPSPTTYRHVIADLCGRIDAVIIGQDCRIGIESTVLDLSGEQPVILRPGGLSREDLETALNCSVHVAGSKFMADKPSSPGMKYRHYSPRAPLILVTGFPRRQQLFIKILSLFYGKQGLQVGILNTTSGGKQSKNTAPERLAAALYRSMRTLDARGVDLILAADTISSGLGLAVRNRLRKAATRVLRV